jgi:hypothetical protein
LFSAAVCGEELLFAEWLLAHGRLDATEDQRLEVLGSRE